MTPQSRESLAEALRAAVRATGKSVNAVAKASGVAQAVLQRFQSRQRGLNLDTADRLCAYLGLELRPTSAADDDQAGPAAIL